MLIYLMCNTLGVHNIIVCLSKEQKRDASRDSMLCTAAVSALHEELTINSESNIKHQSVGDSINIEVLIVHVQL